MATQEHSPASPELSVAKTDVQAPSTLQNHPFLSLEIRRGRTGHPRRPVTTRDFLIGSGPACDLRLGGEDIPAAHSLIVVTDDGVHVQWLSESPQLLVNGEPTHEAILCDGDEIGIGRFEFLVHRVHDQTAAESIPEAEPAQASPDTASLLKLVSEAEEQEQAEDLSDVSAEELVNRLEADQQAVDHFEESLRKGEAALLYAAAQKAEELAEETSESHDEESIPFTAALGPAQGDPIDADLLEELERVIQQLCGFSAELDERANRIARQEATQSEAAELLLDAQKELAAQLERFHKQVAESHESQEPKLRKAA